MSALDKQVGGNHYKGVGIQPVQIAYSIGASPLWLKTAKYLTREKADKQEDLQKALHCVELELDLLEYRATKYIAEMVPYEHLDIKAFAEQYDQSDFIYYVLEKMYFGFYDACILKIEEELNTTVDFE